MSRMLGGFMAGNISAAFAYASDVSVPEKRAASLGLIGAAIGIGFTLGPAIGGLLAGNNLQTASFLLPATVSACLSVVAMLLVVFLLPESNTARVQVPRIGPVRMLLQRPALRQVAAAALLVTTAQSMLDSILGLWALDRFGFGPRTVGLLIFCGAVLAVLTQGGLVRVLVPRLGECKLATIAIVTFVTGLLIVVRGARCWGHRDGPGVVWDRDGRVYAQQLGVGFQTIHRPRPGIGHGDVSDEQQPGESDRAVCFRPAVCRVGLKGPVSGGRLCRAARCLVSVAGQTATSTVPSTTRT